MLKLINDEGTGADEKCLKRDGQCIPRTLLSSTEIQKLISKEAVLEAGTRSSAHYPVIYLAPAY